MKRSISHIRTKRLWLREIDETDTAEIVKIRSDGNVNKYFHNVSKLTQKAHICWYWDEYIKNDDKIEWIAVKDDDGRFVGVYGAKRLKGQEVELSYISVQNLQRQGFASEALGAVMEWCKSQWMAYTAVVSVHRDNTPSLTFAQSMGFDYVDRNGDFMIMKTDIESRNSYLVT